MCGRKTFPAMVSVLALCALILTHANVQAQFGDLIKKKVEAKAEKVVSDATDEALEGKPDPAGQEMQSKGKPGEGVWLNYDFVPGAHTLFYEDFSEDKVGNFPSRLTFVKGNMEVAEWEGRRWLRASSRSDVEIPLPEMLPERFTVEFEYYTGGNSLGAMMRFADPSAGKPHAEFRAHLSGVKGAGVNSTTRTDEMKLSSTPFHCRIMVDGAYVKVYTNEKRTANTPNADLGRDQVIRLHIPGTGSNPVMLTGLRVAGSRVRIYDALEAYRRVVLKGILFALDSEDLLPESTPTLEEIGEMLTSHPDMKIVIEGHTDDRGEDAYNQTLSEKRAQSVRAYLVERHGIAGDRLTVKGHGETQPMDTNDTPQGRHNNRRVEVAVAG